MPQIVLGDIPMEVVQKDIRNVHLSVHPPMGRVTIAAPTGMNLDTIRVFALTKLPWVKKQQQKFLQQEREPARDYTPRESHYFLGKRYLLKVKEIDAPPKVELKHRTIEMHVRPGATIEKRKQILHAWYRKHLKHLALPLVKKWEKKMQVRVNEIGVKKMKTKWGTCKIEAERIWLNLELAKKPIECIEYIIVHEMVHLLERKHNDKFIKNMDKHLPNWRAAKQLLNRLPIDY